MRVQLSPVIDHLLDFETMLGVAIYVIIQITS